MVANSKVRTRPPKPAVLKELEENPGKQPLNKDERKLPQHSLNILRSFYP